MLLNQRTAVEHLIFRWPEAENFRTDEETNIAILHY